MTRPVTGAPTNTDRKGSAAGCITKSIDADTRCNKVYHSDKHFDSEHPLEQDDQWYDRGDKRAGRPQLKHTQPAKSAPTAIASIIVKHSAGSHCDIDVNGNISDHLPCVFERVQTLRMESYRAGEILSCLLC